MTSGESGVIGRGITIRGNVSGTEPLIIEGAIEGAISLESHLTIESSGKVAAEVEVETLTVNGTLEGNIRARQMVAIHAGASVVGTIAVPRVVIDEGAVFKGSIEMDFELPEGV
jgi:cytoskeletal protein CcmA (bactofilin family)